ncbi:Nuclear protein MDM1 [Popillia japonica]|uniref:Nuclear protein MDM1 n=1 Tax=Popillia japonica TaxID=7064 RepID=A0AAW1MZS9_POPJA
MIGSFWNLCRACPSMPVDKLHSEYRSTYRWHEYTGPRQEVIRRAPTTQPNVTANSEEKAGDVQNATRIDEETQNELPKLEPALPRHGSNTGEIANYTGNDRARSEERGVSHWRPSRRSKSEGPAQSSSLNNDENRRESDPDLENTGRDQGLLQKAISKISTEYRLQFAWPQGHTSRRDATDSTPRKSQSMNALKPQGNAIINKKRTDLENKDASELEPLVNDNAILEEEKLKDFNTEYTKKFRPFSQYEYSEGKFTSKLEDTDEIDDAKNVLLNGTASKESWYKEVVELRKKAGEYKNRGWGSDFTSDKLSDVYNKQLELWDQVSRRSSLSALSLASTTHRAYTKEEKEQENTKKSSPTKAQRNADNSAKMVRDMIRHHLERTTGGGELDGLILSPTREKLEPTIPRKDDDSRGSQINSPKKNSPQKIGLQKKGSQKSKAATRTVRSQSVGPVEVTEKRSPKRQSRSATVKEKKTASTNTSSTRRPRPSDAAKNEKNEKEEPPAVEAEITDLEPVVKSPPEPTRVKSPEQIIMRSPDPVNWTVPLDTGKTFTVTQNVREGDITARPQSEVKAWTPPEVPPPVAQSAPPEFPQQKQQQGMSMSYGFSSQSMNSGQYSNILKTASGTSEQCKETTTLKTATATSKTAEPLEQVQPVGGNPTKGISLDDPFNESSSTAKTVYVIVDPICGVSDETLLPTATTTNSTATRSFASDVLEMARSRFDNFWRRNSKDETT